MNNGCVALHCKYIINDQVINSLVLKLNVIVTKH